MLHERYSRSYIESFPVQLQPHHRNYRKRMVKTPKIYFWDTGLACRLLGIENAKQLVLHPLRGALFENWVIIELFKGRFNLGLNANLFFWRNNAGLEVDIIIDKGDRLVPVEIKSGATVSSNWFSSVEKWLDLAGTDAENASIVYGGDKPFEQRRVSVLPWRNASDLI